MGSGRHAVLLREQPSLLRRIGRIAAIVFATVLVCISILAIVVVALTD